MIRKKLSSRRGFSLSEMLVVVAIMSLIGIAIGGGISAAASAYRNITASSQASVLCDTLAVAVIDELRFAEDITVVDDVVTFHSRRYGAGASITSDGGRILIGGQEILSGRAYTGLDAQVTLGGSATTLQAEIVITQNTGGEDRELARMAFQVVPLWEDTTPTPP